MSEPPRPISAFRPGSAGVQITSHPPGRANPSPISQDETDTLIEEYLSPRKLRALTGVDNLEEVKYLEMRVDSSETSLGNFGALLPNMTQLKLNNSIVSSVRDMGSSFPVLRVLWMARCNLLDLDGITAMTSLKELYLAYNEITDLSPLSMMDTLEILDLEGNNITEQSQIEFLSLCAGLRNLTLEGNPICYDTTVESYRSEIRQVLSQVDILDDLPLTNRTEQSLTAQTFNPDWDFLQELEADGTITSLDTVEDREEIVASPIRPNTGYRPGTSLRPSSAMKRLGTARIIGTPASSEKSGSLNRPNSSDSGTCSEPVTDASELTTGDLVCGTPARALRARRRQVKLHDSRSTTSVYEKYHHIPEHTYDPKQASDDENDQLLDELKAWRLQHTEVQKKLEASRAPNVLTIIHDDEDNVSSSENSDSEEGTRTADEDQGFVSRQDNQVSDDDPQISPKSIELSPKSITTPPSSTSPPIINGASLRSRRYKTTTKSELPDNRPIKSSAPNVQPNSLRSRISRPPSEPLMQNISGGATVIRAEIYSPEKPKVDRVSFSAKAAINSKPITGHRPIQALPSKPFQPAK